MKYCQTLLLYSLSFAFIHLLLLKTRATADNFSSPLKFKYGNRKLEACHKNVTNQIGVRQRCFHGHRYCLDIELPFRTIALPDFIPDYQFSSTYDIVDYLKKWEEFRNLPECWNDLQVTLCSIFMPQCDEDVETGKTIGYSRPSVDSCYDLINNSQCKFIERHYGWPSIFNCSNTNLYAKNCTNELRDLRRNTQTSVCHYPLVYSSDTKVRFKDIGGCAIHCKYPVLDDNDQSNIKKFILYLASAGIIATTIAIVLDRFTVVAKSDSSNTFKVTKRFNICQLIVYIGWSIQRFGDIACNLDGSSLFNSELKANGCVLSFFLTYCPTICNLIGYAYLGKLCYETLEGTSTLPSQSETESSKKESMVKMSLLCFGIPSALFITAALLGQIDGHGLYGICTIGQQSILLKLTFVFIPSLIGFNYGNYYFFSIVLKLMSQTDMNKKVRRKYITFLALAILSTLQLMFSIGNYLYEYVNESSWEKSIDNFLACRLNLSARLGDVELNQDSTSNRQCALETKPIVLVYYLEVFSTLALGMVVASFSYTKTNLEVILRKMVARVEPKNKKAKPRSDDTNEEEFLTRGTRNRLSLQHLHGIRQGSNRRISSMDADYLDRSSLASTLLDPYLSKPSELIPNISQSRFTEQNGLVPPFLAGFSQEIPTDILERIPVDILERMQEMVKNCGLNPDLTENDRSDSSPCFTHVMCANERS